MSGYHFPGLERHIARVAREIADRKPAPSPVDAEAVRLFNLTDHPYPLTAAQEARAEQFPDGHEFECGAWMDGIRLMATCPACERDYEMYCAPEELGPDSYLHCGGSPRCLP